MRAYNGTFFHQLEERLGLALELSEATPFHYGDATPAVLGKALAGQTVYEAGLYITELFDGTSPSLQIGDAGDPARLLATTENDPSQVGGNISVRPYTYSVDTEIILTIVAGAGATTGAGFSILSIK